MHIGLKMVKQRRKKVSQKKIDLYNSLSTIKPNKFTHVVKHIDREGIESICECVYNTIYTNLGIPNKPRSKIRKMFGTAKSKRNLKIITNKSIDSERKRKALGQEGEGIGLILATVAPLLASLFSRKTHS